MSNIGCKIVLHKTHIPKDLIERFRGIAVSNLGDCMNRAAAIHHAIRPLNPTPLLGTAFTVKVPQGDNLMLHKAMDLAKPGDVLVIDAGGMGNRAIFGEIMVTYCKTRRLAGIVVDGSIRDYDALCSMDFSVYARGVSPNGPYKNGPGEIGTVITCGGVVVHPGDIIVGDGDGVVAINPVDAEQLLKEVTDISQKENQILDLMRRDGHYPRPWVDEKLAKIGCLIENN